MKKTKTVETVVPEFKLYQIKDSFRKDMGLLKTNLPVEQLQKAWTKHYDDESIEYRGVNFFIGKMKEKYKASFYTFERVFCEDTIYP